jgi:hypothetical protein
MRSIIAASALAAEALRLRDPAREAVEKRAERLVADGAEALITLLRGEVPRAEHRSVRVPVSDERLDERTREIEAVGSRPVARQQLADRREVFAHLLREDEHRLLDVAEVLVEGRR